MAKNLALAVVGFAAAILVAEAALHLLGIWPEISWEWQLTSDVRVLDPDTILIPPRFRTREHFETDGAERVIVALGDSFTEGFPVAAEAAWPALLERNLRREGASVRVLNMGVGNSGTDQHLRILEKYVLPKLEPDDVIWALYANDLSDNVHQGVYTTRGPELVPLDASQHWIYRRRQLWDAIPLPDAVKRRSALLRSGIKLWEASERGSGQPDAAGLAASEERIRLALERAEQLASRHGFTLHLVLIAPQAAYLARERGGAWADSETLREHRILRAILRDHGAFLEVFHEDVPGPAGQAEDTALALFVDASRDHGLPGEHHLNEEGQRRTAEGIGDWMRTRAAPVPGS